ncbi:ATP-binding cassette domain-containing protein [Sphingobacterium sp. DK4209]|uniref:ATP-binding cassette domain-containing protein n=1 Tax=Sphingobacterium zhuxiongii TaxID=2662364 RepID=A0A5Q0QDF1_9SPHI|nr:MULTISPECIES: ATP-binding cassette domain-containing protein [unclassified Sphingobacterium]MVZ66447.1 ATP-binding cassette domain-containing protein [Sphingobacterium sp. DK4209]QGA27294.1 ATP-binding cassette domain-containing protein [Sphingobacterium sp. dk4302]
MNEFVLHTESLSYQYPKGSKLNFENLSVSKQKHTLILGESGSGKSTLLNLIAGFSAPTTGKVFIQGQDIYQLQESNLDHFRAKNLGFIFQEAHLLKNLTIVENIKLAQSLANYPVNEADIIELLKKLQLDQLANRKPNELSRGQVQRVAIARALINKPALLIADEPTAALDDKNTFLVIELIKALADEQGSTLIISTHDKRLKDEFSNNYQLSPL